MEDNNEESLSNPRVREHAFFQNLFETEVDDPVKNHTSADATEVPNPSKSAYLFWQNGVPGIEASDKAIGPAIARKVNPGDIVTAEAFVLFENKTTYTRDLTLSLVSSFGSLRTGKACLPDQISHLHRPCLCLR